VRIALKQASARARNIATALAVVAAAASFAPVAAQATKAGETGYARIERACPAPHAGEATCFALARHRVAASEAGTPGVHPFALRTGAASAGPAGGLTPAQLASAYGDDPSTGGNGQTVAIVDAFDDPNIEADLAAFDTEYKLAACSEANKCFKKVGQTGLTTALPAADKEGWSVEISLDVEAVHATCPGCKVLLVEANSPSFTNLAEATNKAVELGATEISNSYGGAEANAPAVEAAYNHPGVVVAASTGDFGWDSWTYFNQKIAPPAPPRPDIPATLPTVVSVGGTSLTLNVSEKRSAETVWNGNGPNDTSKFIEGAGGGGCSTLYTAPLWQQSAPGFPAAGCAGKRLNADVSAVADPLTGFDIFDSFNCGSRCEAIRTGESWLTIGGTSLSAPLISGMYGLAGGARGVNYPALTLYGHLGGAALFDVTKGGNGYCDDEGAACGENARVEKLAKEFPVLAGVKLDCEGTTACNAATGFDGPTGVGAPASLSLFEPLLPAAAITLPVNLVTGVPLVFGAAGSTDPYPGGTTGASYAWTFGDGGTGSGLTPSHTYSAPGKFPVTLTVTDGYGFKSVPKTVELTVTAPTVKEKEEEAAKHKAEEEAAAKHKAEEEAGRKAGEETARKVAEEVAARTRAAEEAARSAAETHSTGTGGSTGIASFTVTNPDATLAGSSLQAGATGAFTVKITCPAGETSCEGTVTVQTAGAVVASAKAHVLTMATGTFKVAGGKVATIKLHLSRKARLLLARKHTLRVRVTIASHDPSGSSHTSRALATLRASGKHH
jgi:PKD domain-containing protein